MMDYSAISRYGLDHLAIDQNKSYETYDKTTNNHIIHLYFIKDENSSCSNCKSNDLSNVGTKNVTVKYASAIEDNITLILHRRIFKCNECGHYNIERNPFTISKVQTSIQKEIKILQELKSETATFTSIAKKYNVSPTFVMNLFDKKVDISRQKLTPVISFDEIYSKKISKNSYCFIIYSPQLKKVLDVLPSRRKDDLRISFKKIPESERKSVKYVSIDLYDNYRELSKIYFPNAKICADSFHVIKNLNKFFNNIRIKVMNSLSFLKKEKSNMYWLFKKYWKLLLKNRETLSYDTIRVSKSGTYLTPRSIIDYMLSLSSELKLAYELKEEYLTFNSCTTLENAREWFDELILKFQNSNISEYVDFWKLLKNWHEEILNSFNTLNGHRISNGPIERANRTIKTILRISFGSRNFPRIRNRIMFVINDDAAILYNRKTTTNSITGKPRGKYKKNK